MSATAKKELLASLSMVINLSLALLKGVVGVMSGSTALVGDAIHSGADVLASCAAFIGLLVAGRNHPSFPYGLYKAETVATLVSSLVVLLAGYEIGRQALFGSHEIPDVGLTLPVTVGCFVVALGFGFIQLRAGRRLNSPALMADAHDYLVDLRSGTMSQSFHSNPYVELERQKGFKVGRWLLSFKPDQVVVPEKKESGAVALSEEAGVEILAEALPVKQLLPLCQEAGFGRQRGGHGVD